MVIVTYDFRSVIVCYCVPHFIAMTSEYYRVRQVRRGVRDKHPDLVDSTIILHDNARPHKSERVRQILRRWGWEQLEPTAFSPHISPCVFHLIPKIKEPIRGRWFATREDIANAVRLLVTRFTYCGVNAEADGIQRFPHCWQRVGFGFITEPTP
ncbi:histone-lysine N-methyltransferase SETMAR [Trichonephila clavata]|uniref:Histone-lysine N-methyltransferase SETMAR n=1 Tax=Trichonephila clavata TaxID=2740835 RepID=A0A8X6L1L7_TRICU|nr:histone-lysine N-methyltransferase SETMAR [Trichonephila clavata]